MWWHFPVETSILNGTNGKLMNTTRHVAIYAIWEMYYMKRYFHFLCFFSLARALLDLLFLFRTEHFPKLSSTTNIVCIDFDIMEMVHGGGALFLPFVWYTEFRSAYFLFVASFSPDIRLLLFVFVINVYW